MSVLLGNGDGTFRSPTHPIGYGVPLAVAVGDFNNDGNSDLVVSEDGGNSFGDVAVLRGDGQGGFTLASGFGFGNPADGLAVGDLNGDGKLDAIMVAGEGSLGGGNYALLGNGYGGFYAGGPDDGEFLAVPDPRAVAVGDFTGDGIPDLVVAGQGVVILPGLGDGRFDEPIYQIANGNMHTGVAVADFNGDGRLDAVTSDGDTGTISELLGNGNGTLTYAGAYATGLSPKAVAVGDFNGDGRPDAAAANGGVAYGGSNTVSVLLNDGIWDGTPPTPQASSFTVSGFPSPTIAGQAGSFTVTALDSSGGVLTGYTGTLHFTSSDVQASLPANYTFAAADNGTHTFSATLKTAGTQAISVSDATTGVGGVESGITVNAAAAITMIVSGFPSTTTAGVAGSLTVTLKDAYGNVAGGYTGTVHFTSSDAKASLPANYTFTAADAGVHTFSAILKTAGTRSITAKDTVTGSLTGTEGGITVNAAKASQFIIAAPTSVTAGAAFGLTVTVEDAYGNVVTGYTGTIHFTSTDQQAKLPANYTFTAADKGVHTFTGLILQKTGKQTITISDALLSFSDSVDVLPKKK